MDPRYIDTHTHAQFAAFDADREEVMERARKAGVWMVNAGSQADTSRAAVELAERSGEGVYAAVGLHPVHVERSYHDTHELGDGEAAHAFTSRGEAFDPIYYETLARHPKVVAIGECGLDHYRLGSETRERQEKVFRAQIALARKVGKPLVIHCREAYDDLLVILRGEFETGPLPIVSHFFAGTPEHAKALLELGAFFSFGGVATFARQYDESIRLIGLDHMFLETDAPYVTPAPYRGKRNEPSYVPYVAEALAGVLGASETEVARRTTRNARDLFGI